MAIKHDTEAADFVVRRSGRRASLVRRKVIVIDPRAQASEYADMSNVKIR